MRHTCGYHQHRVFKLIGYTLVQLTAMDEADAFFTQTIVGAPFTVLLGQRRRPDHLSGEGLEIDLGSGDKRLTRLWQEWIVLSHACDPIGQPRVRPGRLRRLMERHALWIALLGLTSLLITLAYWGFLRWN